MQTVYLIVGDKGGVGKTYTARIMLDYLRKHKKLQVAAYDSDINNPAFMRIAGDEDRNNPLELVGELDVRREAGIVQLINEMDKQLAPYFIVDMPAGSRESLEQTQANYKLMDTIKKCHYQPILVHVLHKVRESTALLKRMLSVYGDSAKYLVIKNGFNDRENGFELFENSHTKKALEEMDSRVMFLPELSTLTSDLLDVMSLPFEEAAHGTDIDLAHRVRLESYLEDVYRRFDEIGDFLGVDENE